MVGSKIKTPSAVGTHALALRSCLPDSFCFFRSVLFEPFSGLERDERSKMALNFCMVSCIVCSVIASVATTFSDSENLSDVVRTLRGQVNVLLKRRQLEFNKIEDSIKKYLDKNSELATFKVQLDDLRCHLLFYFYY